MGMDILGVIDDAVKEFESDLFTKNAYVRKTNLSNQFEVCDGTNWHKYFYEYHRQSSREYDSGFLTIDINKYTTGNFCKEVGKLKFTTDDCCVNIQLITRDMLLKKNLAEAIKDYAVVYDLPAQH